MADYIAYCRVSTDMSSDLILLQQFKIIRNSSLFRHFPRVP